MKANKESMKNFQLHDRRNHKTKIDISQKFLEEYASRGFEITQDSGGTFHETYNTDFIKKVQNNIYEINPGNNRKMAFVTGKTFIKTIYQIESIVKYKLFK